MPKKVVLKTAATTASVADFLNTITDAEKRKEAKTIAALMKKITGKPARMWGTSIVGFDTYTYKRSNGDVGQFMAAGFSPRKSALTIYIMPGYQDYEALLKKLGPHKTGKACLYIKCLADIDMKVLEELIARGYKDLKRMYPEP